jgi:hypothetical protein
MEYTDHQTMELRTVMEGLRSRIDPVFSVETAVPGTASQIPSAGHCAVVSAIAHADLGCEMVSAIVNGQSHWYSRLTSKTNGCVYDVDITGDQFGYAPVRVAEAGTLYPGTRVRDASQLNAETLRRAILLADRAGIDSASEKLKEWLATRERAPRL